MHVANPIARIINIVSIEIQNNQPINTKTKNSRIIINIFKPPHKAYNNSCGNSPINLDINWLQTLRYK